MRVPHDDAVVVDVERFPADVTRQRVQRDRFGESVAPEDGSPVIIDRHRADDLIHVIGAEGGRAVAQERCVVTAGQVIMQGRIAPFWQFGKTDDAGPLRSDR